MPIEERLLVGLFVCEQSSNEILHHLKPEWNENIQLPAKSKFLLIDKEESIRNIFPWKDELNKEIDHEKFCESFLVQPELFIRTRPGHHELVKSKLEKAGCAFTEPYEDCLAVQNQARLNELLLLDREAVIQDYNSQRVGEFINLAGKSIQNNSGRLKIWDCCAASGGKSILAYDTVPNIDLTATDVRESILINLQKRFERAGIKNYRSKTIDLVKLNEEDHLSLKSEIGDFDLIICDAPCTGSGTWSRTPEQLYYFDEKRIKYYSELQRKIVLNVIPHLNQKGMLLYITCSVFAEENESLTNFILDNSKLKLQKIELLKGYEMKADTMFAALFSN